LFSLITRAIRIPTKWLIVVVGRMAFTWCLGHGLKREVPQWNAEDPTRVLVGKSGEKSCPESQCRTALHSLLNESGPFNDLGQLCNRTLSAVAIIYHYDRHEALAKKLTTR
jgi:hypothetical protein